MMANDCIVLINPFDIEQDGLSEEIHSGILYLASYLRARFGGALDIKFLDLKVEAKKAEVCLPFNLEGNPGMLPPVVAKWEDFRASLEAKVAKKVATTTRKIIFAISCLTSKQFVGTLVIGIALRSCFPDASIVVGGYHPSSCIADFLPYGAIFDYIVMGEGELALGDIAALTQEGKVPPSTGFPRIVHGQPVRNLDELPVLNLGLFADYLSEYPTLGINLSRGCPFSCDFCAEGDLMTKSWRAYSPERVLVEIRNQVRIGQEFGIRRFGFYDPVFGHDPAWRRKVLEKIALEHFGVEFWGETRLDNISRGDLDLCNQANLHLMFGLESGSPAMLKSMGKTGNPRLYLDQFRKIMGWSGELGYTSVVNVMFNHPGETTATMAETQRFLLDILRKHPNVLDNATMFRHFPGTKISKREGDYTQKFGAQFFGGKWWHLLRFQRKASTLNQASYHLPVYTAYETFLQYEQTRLEVILDGAAKRSPVHFSHVLHMKKLLAAVKTELKDIQEDEIFFSNNPPQVPASLRGELPLLLEGITLEDLSIKTRVC